MVWHMTPPPRGRPPTYPFAAMQEGDTISLPAPTPADSKRLARNASIYGLRHQRVYTCRTIDGVTTITRTQ
jgi:hypothetical protein